MALDKSPAQMSLISMDRNPRDTPFLIISTMNSSFPSTEEIPLLFYQGSDYYTSLTEELRSDACWIKCHNCLVKYCSGWQAPTEPIQGVWLPVTAFVWIALSPGKYTRFLHCLVNSVSKDLSLCLWAGECEPFRTREKEDYVWLKWDWWFVSINYWDDSTSEWNGR